MEYTETRVHTMPDQFFTDCACWRCTEHRAQDTVKPTMVVQTEEWSTAQRETRAANGNRFWREQCELREKALVEREGQLEAAEKRLELEREYALYALRARRIHSMMDRIESDAVSGLVSKYALCAIGTCDRCGKRAPLKEGPPGPPVTYLGVCAWGCEVEP